LRRCGVRTCEPLRVRMIRGGRLTMLDARAMLAAFMTAGRMSLINDLLDPTA